MFEKRRVELFFHKDLAREDESNIRNYIHFYGHVHPFDSKKNVNTIDLKTYIAPKVDSWLDSIDSWHQDLCSYGEKHMKLWWYLGASRLIAWYPSVLQEMIFAYGVFHYINEYKLDSVHIVGANQNIISYLLELSPNWIIDDSRNYCKKKKPYFLIIKRLLLQGLQLTRLLKRSVLNLFKELPKTLNADKFIYTYLMNPGEFDDSKDHFFGDMFDHDQNFNKDEFAWLYFVGDLSKKSEDHIIRTLKKSAREGLIIQNIIRPIDVVKITLRSLRFYIETFLYMKKLPSITIESKELKLFSSIFFNEQCLLLSPIVEMENYYALRRIREKYQMKAMIYPFEDKGGERALLDVFKGQLTLFGHAHAVHNKGHMFLRQRQGVSGIPLRPDYIACSGPSAKDWIIRSMKVDESMLVTLGSKRFYSKVNNEKSIGTRIKFLVLISQGYEVDMLANIIEQEPTLFLDHDLTVRLYPYSWQEQQREGVKRIKKVLAHVKVEEKSLEDQLEWCDVTLFSSTSAGIEAVLWGRISSCIDLHHIFPLDPVEGRYKSSEMLQCFNISDIKRIILQLQNMTSEEYENKIEQQRIFAEGVYSKPGTIEVKNIV